VYDADTDHFDIAETLRQVLDTNWIGDILPSKRRQARQLLSEQVSRVFPFASKFVDDYVRDALRLEPLHTDGLSQGSIVSDSNLRPWSVDSDVESLGSLDDFVVDDEEKSETSSVNSSVSSDYSDPEPKRKKSKASKPKKKSYSSVSDDDASSSSYSTS
jgi:hypothetical protein